MRVEYSANNSGGDWWLDDEDWERLKRAGWELEGAPEKFCNEDGRFLGALYHYAYIEAESVEAAKEMWERVVGQDADEDGCLCCGQPHNFYEV